MTNYILDGHDLSDLFDTRRPSFSFKDNPRHIIPDKGSILYSVWDGEEQFIYIGISGLQKSLSRRNPISRMQSHASGRRSGDQFCIYVHDYFVVPQLDLQQYDFVRGGLDRLTKQYIQEELFYRFVVIQNEESIQLVRKIENELKTGFKDFGKPLLNDI